MTAVNSARRAVLRNAPLVSAVVNALPDDVRVLVLTNDRDAFEVQGNERSRVEFVAVPQDVPITIWPQDPFLVLEQPDAPPVLLRSRRFERAGDAQMASAIASHLGWNERTSELSFEGGNVVAGARHVFIGADTVRLNAIALDIEEAAVVRSFEEELGRPVLVVGPFPQPVGHIDMVLTPASATLLVLADPGRGAAIARRALTDAPASVQRFARSTRREFFADPRITELALSDGQIVRAPDISGATASAVRRSEAIAPLFDALAEALRSQGYEVVRVPFLSNLDAGFAPGGDPVPRPYQEVLDYPVLSYNNVVLARKGDGARVYMPRYGLAPLDDAAAQAWRDAGFDVRAVDGFAASAFYGGALRCTLKVLERD